MPVAKCEKCGEEVSWHNYRGVKLENIPCPKCGGRLRPRWYGKTKAPRARLKREEWDRAILELLKTPLEERELFERLNKIPKFEKRLDAYRHLRRLVWEGKVEESPSKEPYALASQNVYQTHEVVG